MRDHLQAKLDDTVTALLARLEDQCKHVADALQDGKRFWDTLIPNLKDEIHCVRRLNLAEDENIDKACNRIERNLCKLDAEALRKDDHARQRARTEAQRIAKQMSSWM
jgi:hypothetical protein